METKILHEFLVLSRINNYARAADELSPAITQEINVIYPDLKRYAPIMKKALKCFSS